MYKIKYIKIYKNVFSQHLNISKIRNSDSPKESILINSLSSSYFSQKVAQDSYTLSH